MPGACDRASGVWVTVTGPAAPMPAAAVLGKAPAGNVYGVPSAGDESDPPVAAIVPLTVAPTHRMPELSNPPLSFSHPRVSGSAVSCGSQI